jgi:hypothetical protein
MEAKMKRRSKSAKKTIVMTIIFMLAVFSYNLVNAGQNSTNVKVITNSVCKGVGVVGSTFQGKKSAPIMVMEEAHNSRAAQIQHAIALVRLYSKFGLRDIALEGYLKDDTKIDTDWYYKAARKDTRARIEVAVCLLEEGEISSAEFLKLAYEDVSLHPIEISKEYNVELGEKAQSAPLLCLLKIARSSLTQNHLLEVQRLDSESKKLNGEKRNEKIRELLNYILSADPWVKQTADTMRSEDFFTKVPLQRHVKIMEEIKKRAEVKSVNLTPDEITALDNYIAFSRGRANANYTMVDATINVADRKGVPVVAMIIGCAHTQKICELLKKEQRSYAVITPMALKNADKRGDLDYEMFERKYQKQSVFTEGFLSNVLKRTFQASANKKPGPVLNEPWLNAKSELYLFTDRIVRAVFGGGGQDPPKPPKPPGEIIAGFDDDEFKGRYIFIHPKKIELVSADGKNGKKDDAVIIQAIITSEDRNRETEIWLKAMPTKILDEEVPADEQDKADKQDHEFVEFLLKKALTKVQSEKKSSRSIENQFGQIEITFDTLLCMGENKSEVRMVNLSTK